MAGKRKAVPAYRLHKSTGRAVVTVRDADGRRKDVYLGPHDSAESRQEYARVIAGMRREASLAALCDSAESLCRQLSRLVGEIRKAAGAKRPPRK